MKQSSRKADEYRKMAVDASHVRGDRTRWGGTDFPRIACVIGESGRPYGRQTGWYREQSSLANLRRGFFIFKKV